MMSGRRTLAAAGLALLVVIAAVTAITLSTAGTNLPPTSAAARNDLFLTAAAMPQGLGDRGLPRFDLADARGATISSARLRGRPAILTFLYTRCVDVCPLIGTEIHDVSPQTPGDPRSSHTAVIWLINRRGRLAAFVPAGTPIDTHNLAHDLGVLIGKT